MMDGYDGDSVSDFEWDIAEGNYLKDGEPCCNPGCLSHVSHPCEGCGRVGGREREGSFIGIGLLNRADKE